MALKEYLVVSGQGDTLLFYDSLPAAMPVARSIGDAFIYRLVAESAYSLRVVCPQCEGRVEVASIDTLCSYCEGTGQVSVSSNEEWHRQNHVWQDRAEVVQKLAESFSYLRELMPHCEDDKLVDDVDKFIKKRSPATIKYVRVDGLTPLGTEVFYVLEAHQVTVERLTISQHMDAWCDGFYAVGEGTKAYHYKNAYLRHHDAVFASLKILQARQQAIEANMAQLQKDLR